MGPNGKGALHQETGVLFNLYDAEGVLNIKKKKDNSNYMRYLGQSNSKRKKV